MHGRLEERARADLERMTTALEGADCIVDGVIAFGHRVREIIERSAEHDLMVLSSHPVDSGDVAGRWLGLSHRAAILARCPVLLVK